MQKSKFGESDIRLKGFPFFHFFPFLFVLFDLFAAAIDLLLGLLPIQKLARKHH